MADPPGPEEPRDEGERLRALRVFGPFAPGRSALFLLALGFVVLGLGLVGLAVAYELTGELWAAPLGLLLGATAGLAFARDFARWRVSLGSVVSVLVLVALFALTQWLAGR